PVKGHVSMDVAIFENIPGGARLTIQSIFRSVADRDGMMAAGMERGVREGFDKLDQILIDKR
ncbi:MAG: hypothetical protein ACTHJ0_04335, partial [Flavipsychrobacter sp.]